MKPFGEWRLESGLLTYVVYVDESDYNEISVTIRERTPNHYNLHLEVDCVQEERDVFGTITQAMETAELWAMEAYRCSV